MIRFATVVLVVASSVHAAPDETLLADVSKQLDRAYSNRDPESPYNDKNLKKLRDSTAGCLAAIDRALAGGATLDTEVQMPHSKFPNARKVKNKLGYPVTVAPLREAQTYCRALAAKPNQLMLEGVVHAADQRLSKASRIQAAANAKSGFDNQARAEAEVMVRDATTCRAAVDRAVSAGVAGTATVTLPHSGRVGVGELRAKVCDRLAEAGQAIIALEDAKLEKKLAPYKAVLKGGKLKTFLDRKMIFDTIYGPGAVRLDTPAKLAAASAWFIVLEGDVGIGRLKYVKVRRYAWAGNKLAGIQERTGCCT